MRKTEKEQEIIELINSGVTIKEVIKTLNIKESQVRSVIYRLKLKFNKEKQGGSNVIDITGKRFWSLIVIDRSSYKTGYSDQAWWNCLCDCGKKCIKKGGDLRSGRTKTCGCRTNINFRNNWQGCGFIPKTKWKVISNNAIQRNHKLLVTIEECNDIYIKQNKKCYLSGLPISFDDNTASLDRIDNSKDYIKGNVAWCHKDINLMKHAKDKEYFIELCKAVANNNELQNNF